MKRLAYMITDDDELGRPRAILSSNAECAMWLGCSTKKVSELIKSQRSYKGFRVECIYI